MIIYEIKQSVTITDVVERYGCVKIKRNRCACPLHNGKDLNMVIYPQTNSFYCFVCGKGGDVIRFVQEAFNLSLYEAERKLDYDFNLCLFEKPTLTKSRKTKEKIRLLMAEREENARQRAYNKYVYFTLVDYIWRLRAQPESKQKSHDLKYMDRLTEQMLSPDVVFPLNVDSLIFALKTKFESEVM